MPDAPAEFTDVYRRHLPAVSAYLARRVDRADVEDLAADTFAIAWRKRDAVAAGEELPWLYRIASYQVANHRRRLAIRASALGLLSAPDSAPGADAFVEADPELAAAWRGLPARHREILALVVLDELPVGEAAIALGISPNATSIRLHRAKKALADALAGARTDAGGQGSDPDSSPGERSAPAAT
ncbi:RNA polymerase sigma factor [Protaetiibacter intestinalis]|uniref:Sigma-70 family RNA polymerase sigma factor n=1 Tax=Protaetiibacter intestinalis TaxID=2419774 RepID=A0A387BCN8_9MICO|nr:sigma-70 family RNA polymerase sigma factor [Protaetiibacter intestinalis]AYF98855.1 sigma-70 family RNA polymerase sigma factor [Protaetiibacter intestinalis]